MPVKNKITDLFSVEGLVAVITGGGSGLGLYAARALDANGAKAVYIIGRREETLQKAAKTATNGTIKALAGDVTDKASLEKIVEQIRREQGYINLLFCNAGISGPKDRASLTEKTAGEKPTVKEFQDAMWEPDMDDFTKALHFNCTAVHYTTTAFLDLLDAGNKNSSIRQDSQVLITSSVAGFSRQLASSFAYSVSKAAVTHLMKMLSTAFAQNGFHIRVNLIAPGLYPSDMTEGHTKELERLQGNAFAGAHRLAPDSSPSERTGSEQDFAGLILFLASEAGAHISGETLVTDGGRLAQLPSVY